MATRNLTKARRKPAACSKPPFVLEGIDHILLLVKGMKPAVWFYTDVLGCKIEGKLPQYGMLQLRAGSALIDLVDISVPEAAWAVPPVADGRNLDHLCLALGAHDEAKLRRHLAASHPDRRGGNPWWQPRRELVALHPRPIWQRNRA